MFVVVVTLMGSILHIFGSLVIYIPRQNNFLSLLTYSGRSNLTPPSTEVRGSSGFQHKLNQLDVYVGECVGWMCENIAVTTDLTQLYALKFCADSI